MPLIPNKLRKELVSTIYSGLQREFPDAKQRNEQTDAYHKKLANALADIAMPIIEAIVNDAQVLPGIPVSTAGSAAAQAGTTTAPGKIG